MKKSVIIGKETYNLISPTIKGTDMAIKSLGEITERIIIVTAVWKTRFWRL